MSPSSWRVALVACVTLSLCGCGMSEAEVLNADEVMVSSVEGELRTNSRADRLVVYSNNLENMIFDWKDLVHVMAEDELRPDLFLVQQVTSRSELGRLMNFMKARLGVDYDGVVAQNQPTDDRFDGQVTPRPTVTTGVIWRSRRFELVAKDSWMPYGSGFSPAGFTCDKRSNNSGYETQRVRLFDRIAKKHVVVVSTRQWTWHPCTSKNVREIVNGFEGGPNDHSGLGTGAALQIVGGDFNDKPWAPDGSYECWYRQMNRALPESACGVDVNLGFTDPLFVSCKGEKSCVKDRGWVDSLFVRRSDGKAAKTDHFDIVSWEQAHRASLKATGGDGPSNSKAQDGYVDQADRYSGHEARKAYVYYE